MDDHQDDHCYSAVFVPCFLSSRRFRDPAKLLLHSLCTRAATVSRDNAGLTARQRSCTKRTKVYRRLTHWLACYPCVGPWRQSTGQYQLSMRVGNLYVRPQGTTVCAWVALCMLMVLLEIYNRHEWDPFVHPNPWYVLPGQVQHTWKISALCCGKSFPHIAVTLT